jgi:hypothetical protein
MGAINAAVLLSALVPAAIWLLRGIAGTFGCAWLGAVIAVNLWWVVPCCSSGSTVRPSWICRELGRDDERHRSSSHYEDAEGIAYLLDQGWRPGTRCSSSPARS